MVTAGRRLRNRPRICVAVWPKPCPAAARKAGPAARVRVRALERQSGEQAHGAGRREHRRVVPVHLVGEGALAQRVQAVESEVDPPAVGPDQAVEADREPALVLVPDRLRRAEQTRTARYEDALAILRVERDRHLGEDRAGELPAELGDQDRAQDRPLVDSLPTDRIVHCPDLDRFPRRDRPAAR